MIDVRDIGEIRATGKARGALHIPMMMLRTKADPGHPEHDRKLSPEKPVALYCAAGARSQMAGQLMLRLGYTEVYNIGGLGDWRAAGGAVAR